MFGGADDRFAKYGHAGMAGLLVRHARELLCHTVADGPNKTALGKHLQPRVKLNVLSAFLNGMPSKDLDWFRHARTLMRFLTLGSRPDTSGARYEVFGRIDQYFFRDFKQRESSPFFHRARRQHGTPCSPRELAGEIAWYTRQHKNGDNTARLVWVSGGPEYFADGTDGEVAKAVAAAIEANVGVTFAYFPEGKRKGVKSNLDDFFNDHHGIKELGRHVEMDLSTMSTVNRWWEFCSGIVSYLYVIAQRDHECDEALYIVREPRSGQVAGDGGDEIIPLALRATAGELERYRAWWDQVSRMPISKPAETLETTVKKARAK
jgi:hypothetical protein